MTPRRLWVLAGPNGSGKSTYFEQRLRQHFSDFVNADEIARELSPDNPDGAAAEAQRAADSLRQKLLAAGKSFCTETVFSHVSKVQLLEQARALGYDVLLIFVCTENPALNAARILSRVEKGGHNVPLDKVRPRYERSLALCAQAIRVANEVWLVDNTDSDRAFRHVARFQGGQLSFWEPDAPAWASRVLAYWRTHPPGQGN